MRNRTRFCENKNRAVKQLMIAATCTLFLLAAEAQVTPPAEPSFFALSLEELLQVEVTGSTLTSENIRTVPSAVTVFTHQEIQRMGVDTLDELMNFVPGFQSYRTATTPANYPFSARGRRIGFPAAEILILVNGQRLAGPRTSGSEMLVPKFPLMHIARVEFIRGPGSVMYGSNAMLGVINIVTRSDVNEIQVGYGSFDRQQMHLLTSQQLGEVTLDLFVHHESDQGDDYRVPDSFSVNQVDTDDPRELTNLDLKLQWRDTQINVQHNQIRAENFYEIDRVSNGVNQQKSELSSFSIKQDFPGAAVDSWLWLSYSISTLEVSNQLSDPGAFTAISSPSSSEPLFSGADYEKYNEMRGQWHFDWEINDRSRLQYGIEVRHMDAPETRAKSNFDFGDLVNGTIPIRSYDGLQENAPLQSESNRDIVGLYGQYQRQLLEATYLTLGLRHDEFSHIGSNLSSRFGLVQEIGDHHSLKLLFGEAFRAPSENELNLVNNPILLGNPDLKPETVQTWDLIWIGQWKHTAFSLGYFENHFKDAIVQAPLSDGTIQYENKDQNTVKGVEFELSHELNKFWLVRGTYSTIFEKPDLTFREADQFASLMVNRQQGNWNANLAATYFCQREILTAGNSRDTLDAYWQLSSKLSCQLRPDWHVFLQIKNLLDEEYYTPPENSLIRNGVPNRGREFLIGMRYNF
jgi:outer membrane receptor protein involved in Fe transport